MSALTIALNIVGYNMAGGAFSGVAYSLRQVTNSASGLKKVLADLNTTNGQLALGAGAAAGLFLLFGSAVKNGVGDAADLEQELLRLRQALQVNQDAVPVLTQAVNDLGIKTVYSSGEAADAFTQLVKSGFNASQVMYGAGAAADEYKQHAYDAAEATHGLGFEALALGQMLGIDATDGATLASTAVHQFWNEVQNSKDPTAAATQIVNDLAGAYLNVTTTGPDMLAFLQQAGPTAASLNINFQDLMTTADVLGQHWGSLDIVGTRLRYFLQTLIHPTAAQAKELANLGIWTVNTTDKYRAFEQQLIATGAASEKDIKHWDGSVAGLQEMFKAAQKVGAIPLDTNFQDWAVKTGFLNSKLYDAHGNLKSLKDIIDTVTGSLKNMTPAEQAAALSNLFNVRSGDIGRTIADMSNFDSEYKKVQDRIKNTDVVKNAAQALDTFKGSWQALTDSFKSGLAVAFLPLLPAFTNLFNSLNNLIGLFLQAPPAVQGAVGAFLIVGMVLSAVAVVVLGGAALFGFLSTAIAGTTLTVGGLLGPVLLVAGAILLAAGVIVGLVLWLKHLYDTNAQVRGAIQWVWSELQMVWVIIKGLVIPIFEQLWANLQTQLLPVWIELKQSFQELAPILIPLGQAIIGILVVGFLAALAVIVGLITGIANFVAGVAQALAGLVGIVAGVIKFLTDLWFGFFGILDGILHGNGDEIQAYWNAMWSNLYMDALSIIGSMWTTIEGLFQASVGTVVGIVQGFYETVTNTFYNLWDTLVGHSIVPETTSGIISAFATIPGGSMPYINDLYNQAVAKFGNLKDSSYTQFQTMQTDISSQFGLMSSNATTHAVQMQQAVFQQLVTMEKLAVSATKEMAAAINSILNSEVNVMRTLGMMMSEGLAGGIRAMAGSVSGAIGSVVQSGINHAKQTLGIASPSKVFAEIGANTVLGLVQGVTNGHSQVQSAYRNLVTPTGNLSSGGLAIQNANATVSMRPGAWDKPVNIYIGNKQVGQAVIDFSTGKVKRAGVSRMRG